MKRICILFAAASTSDGDDDKEVVFMLQTFPELSQDSVGFHFYEASHLLAAYLAWNLKPATAGAERNVLELGSGSCGLAGLTMSRLNYPVTFTDLPIILPYLQLNVERNMKTTGTIQELAWGNGNFEPKEYHYIVAADCTYVRSSVIPFLETIVACLAKRGECYVAHEEREAGMEIYLEEQAKAHKLRVKKIKPAAFPQPFTGLTHFRLFKMVRM